MIVTRKEGGCFGERKQIVSDSMTQQGLTETQQREGENAANPMATGERWPIIRFGHP